MGPLFQRGPRQQSFQQMVRPALLFLEFRVEAPPGLATGANLLFDQCVKEIPGRFRCKTLLESPVDPTGKAKPENQLQTLCVQRLRLLPIFLLRCPNPAAKAAFPA